MIDLRTKYMGLELKNPIIAGSSGLTNTVANLQELEKQGVGAICLKSIFEEQITHETKQLLNSNDPKIQEWKDSHEKMVKKNPYIYSESLEYISNFAKENTVEQYLKFISEAKKTVKVPIIASIHCVSQYDWTYFAKRIQNAGADAIELNVYILPSDFERKSEENEKIYFDIIAEVKKYITIPIALKIGFYFSGLSNTVMELSKTGISGLVLFNRQFRPDIDIEKIELTASNIYSNPTEYSHTLRWIAILSGRVKCDIAATSGIHNYESVVKNLLAGANAVQIASVLYKDGFTKIASILSDLEKWMQRHNFNKIDDFRGKLSQVSVENPAAYERVQFMKLYSNIE